MRRLYSFIIILMIGIAAGTAGSFWYSRPSETMAATAVVEPSAPAKEGRKVLYYRNPMGAPDTSPVIPVYADEVAGADGSVRISAEKVQRAGVRTEVVSRRVSSSTVRALRRGRRGRARPRDGHCQVQRFRR